MTENQITIKTITELLGMNFFIPSYQRGYRWTKTNVLQLLDDIWEYRQTSTNQKTFYCLQPIVVRSHSWQNIHGDTIHGYELIDGQQRLTTLHRIITYLALEFLKVESLKEDYKKELYTLYYETRLDSASFLSRNHYDSSKPDLCYMSEAYVCVKEWLEDTSKGFGRAEKNRFLDALLPELTSQTAQGVTQFPEWSVQVIWYEIKDSLEKSENLFSRLNRGKIPLTSAELIKARFVNNQSMWDLPTPDQTRRKTELIQLWDEIEVQLNDPGFWAFITNVPALDYSNKIEILFDTITGKGSKDSDPLFSYVNFFSPTETSETLWRKWVEIEEIFRSLVYWYRNKAYYHKIGYLITTGTTIKALIKLKKEKPKKEFLKILDEHIAKQIPDNWEDLRYDKNDRQIITNVLLLHNLEKMNGKSPEIFPFAAYKEIKKSLEHIHAQNIEDMDPRIKEPWITWLIEHLNILKDVRKDDDAVIGLEEQVKNAIPKLDFNEFKILANKLLQLLPTDSDNSNEYLHKIENLALLGLTENSILSNSVFELKRRKVVALDKKGAFLPIATKRIFLKYFASETYTSQSIWTKEERMAYKKDIGEALQPYLTLKQKTQ